VQMTDSVARNGLDTDVVQTAVVTGTVADAVGTFRYTVLGGGRIAPDPAWVASHIATKTVPILGTVTCNRLMFPQLEAALREVLTAVGLDPAEFQFSHPESGGGAGSFVSAERVIDGQSTGLTWSATVVADGVQSLSGQLAPLVDLGEYDVIGATSAVQRMADPRFGSGYAGVMPLATADAPAMSRTLDSTAEAAPVTESTVPPSVTPGAAIDWPVQQVTITEARLGLSQVVQSDGAVLLAPAYEFTGDDGGVWGVIAVAESALSFG